MELETKIKERLVRTRENAIQIGKDLIEAKKLLEPASFQPWVTNQFGYSWRTTQLLIDAALATDNVAAIADRAVLSMAKEMLQWK
jgi:hypothetical protein